jgi:hypothetical protein
MFLPPPLPPMIQSLHIVILCWLLILVRVGAQYNYVSIRCLQLAGVLLPAHSILTGILLLSDWCSLADEHTGGRSRPFLLSGQPLASQTLFLLQGVINNRVIEQRNEEVGSTSVYEIFSIRTPLRPKGV